MKRAKAILGLSMAVAAGSASAAPAAKAPPKEPPTRFVSTVQMAIQEPNQALLRRSQKLVRDQFATVFATWPEFRGKDYDLETSGNEVVLSLVTHEDVRDSMQQAVANIVEHLNGRVHARGRSMFYRTSMEPQGMGGYLEVVVDDTHTKIRSISAQSVPLRDVLKEVRFQLGSLSYLVPGECAQRLVDWSFGVDEPLSQPKSVDSLMTELATLFGLKSEKKNGTYIFTGSCAGAPSPSPRARPVPPAADLLRSGLVPTGHVPASQVYFPWVPLD